MPKPSYQVFLSFNSEDREIIQQIAVYLADKAQLPPWLDEWSQIPGEPFVRNLERGLEASATCAVFVGRSGQGPWQQPEVEAALRRQVKDKTFRVIPVMLPGAPQKPELPLFLEGNHWVDLRKGLQDDNALWRLECGIRGVEPGRGRPKPADAPLDDPLQVKIGPVDVAISKAPQSVHIFISYHHQEPDGALAHAFAEALKRAGHHVFIDTGITWGVDWAKSIRSALERADYLLLMLSKESAISKMVVEEVSIACELARSHAGTPVILPVRIRYPFSEPLPYQISDALHTVQQEQWEGQDDTVRLIHRLLETVIDRASWPETAEREAPTGSLRSETPMPYLDPRDLITPSGEALDTDSRFYVPREADEWVLSEILKRRAILTVRGPHQVGKTSLVMRAYMSACQSEAQMRAIFVDFQALQHKDLQSPDTLWMAIAARTAKQLRLKQWDYASWQPDAGYEENLTSLLEGYVFDDNETPLLICMDEVDRIFGAPIKSDFFSSLRYLYGKGAYDAIWRKVRWLLSTSSEPSFFIEDLNQSPFNIGLRVEISTFNTQELAVFARRFGLDPDVAMLDDMMDFIGGQPYLSHLLLYHWVRNPASRLQLFNTQVAGTGIFRDHLRYFLMQFLKQKDLAAAMQSIVDGHGCDNAGMADRIEAAGLTRRDKKGKVVPLCRLYAEFFKNELH